MDTILFYILASVCVVSALLVVTRVNPLISAIWLIVTLLGVAGVFATLSASFLAVLQVLIYTGAIAVLFIFVIMLINLGPDALKERVVKFRKVVTVAVSFYLLAVIFLTLWKAQLPEAPKLPENFNSIAHIGSLLLHDYIVPFEVISILLFSAVIGTVVLAKKDL